MVGLTRERRRILIDKLPDAANLALGALVFVVESRIGAVTVETGSS